MKNMISGLSYGALNASYQVSQLPGDLPFPEPARCSPSLLPPVSLPHTPAWRGPPSTSLQGPLEEQGRRKRGGKTI